MRLLACELHSATDRPARTKRGHYLQEKWRTTVFTTEALDLFHLCNKSLYRFCAIGDKHSFQPFRVIQSVVQVTLILVGSQRPTQISSLTHTCKSYRGETRNSFPLFGRVAWGTQKSAFSPSEIVCLCPRHPPERIDFLRSVRPKRCECCSVV